MGCDTELCRGSLQLWDVRVWVVGGGGHCYGIFLQCWGKGDLDVHLWSDTGLPIPGGVLFDRKAPRS